MGAVKKGLLHESCAGGRTQYQHVRSSLASAFKTWVMQPPKPRSIAGLLVALTCHLGSVARGAFAVALLRRMNQISTTVEELGNGCCLQNDISRSSFAA